MEWKAAARAWRGDRKARVLRTVDLHTAGEPLRVVVEGWPELRGATILARRRHAIAEHEALRRALMWEPRGHADMYGALPTPAATPDGHGGVLFLHNEGYSTMCGHGVIGLVTLGVEAGVYPEPEVRLDTPAGRVTARAHVEEGRVVQVAFENVPSFLLHPDLEVDLAGVGRVSVDIGFGGAFYAYVDARDVGLELVPREFRRIVELGSRLRAAVAAAAPLIHPAGDADLNFLYGTIFHRPLPPGGLAHERNVCVFAEGELDRSPTGTGVSGRAAVLAARGRLEAGAALTIESLIGTRFEVTLVRATSVGGQTAYVPRVTGSAHVTGRHEFLIDPRDPLAEGFFLR